MLKWFSGTSQGAPLPSAAERARQIVDQLCAADGSALARLAQDRSGYLRQAALERAIALHVPALLPILALRLNDHVDAIGRRARAEMLAQVAIAPVPELLRTLPAVIQLRSVGRTDHSAWLARFEVAFLERVGVRGMEDALLRSTPDVGRSCMDVLCRHGLVAASLIRRLLASSADIVVLRSVLALVRTMSQQARTDLYAIAAGSRLGAIRAMVIPELLGGEPDTGKEARAIAALLDSQARVREAAIAYLRARQFDVVACYHGVLCDPASKVKIATTALLGLESLRAHGELPFLRTLPFASPVLRRTALRVWIKLAPLEKDAIALVALRDPAAGVRRFAYTAVNRYGAHIPSELVFAALGPVSDPELYRQFAERNRWDWLMYLGSMAIATCPDSPAWGRLSAGLTQWARASSQLDRATVPQLRALQAPDLTAALERLTAARPGVAKVVADELARLPRLPD